MIVPRLRLLADVTPNNKSNFQTDIIIAADGEAHPASTACLNSNIYIPLGAKDHLQSSRLIIPIIPA